MCLRSMCLIFCINLFPDENLHQSFRHEVSLCIVQELTFQLFAMSLGKSFHLSTIIDLVYQVIILLL